MGQNSGSGSKFNVFENRKAADLIGIVVIRVVAGRLIAVVGGG